MAGIPCARLPMHAPRQAPCASSEPPLAFDHVMIFVQSGAPEQAALKKAGFTVAPTVNRHDGQGTAPVTVEFLNGFVELVYPEPTVTVAPELQAVAQKFRDRSNWRETGLPPSGLQLHKTAAAPVAFAFPTFKVHSPWMAANENIEILTPREMPNALGLYVPPHDLSEARNLELAADPVKGAMFHHPNGASRVTRVEVAGPSAASFPPAAAYAAQDPGLRFTPGSEWLLILTLDGGHQGKVRDLDPGLPLVMRY